MGDNMTSTDMSNLPYESPVEINKKIYIKKSRPADTTYSFTNENESKFCIKWMQWTVLIIILIILALVFIIYNDSALLRRYDMPSMPLQINSRSNEYDQYSPDIQKIEDNMYYNKVFWNFFA
jgi:hypothetical protein